MEKYLLQDLWMEESQDQEKGSKEDSNSILLQFPDNIFLRLIRYLVEFNTCQPFRGITPIQSTIIKENIHKWEKLMLGVKIKEVSLELVIKSINTSLKKLSTLKKDLKRQFAATIFQQVYPPQTKHIFGEIINIFAIEK